MFDPKYKLTDRIISDLTAIAEAKGIIDRAKILPQGSTIRLVPKLLMPVDTFLPH